MAYAYTFTDAVERPMDLYVRVVDRMIQLGHTKGFQLDGGPSGDRSQWVPGGKVYAVITHEDRSRLESMVRDYWAGELHPDEIERQVASIAETQ